MNEHFRRAPKQNSCGSSYFHRFSGNSRTCVCGAITMDKATYRVDAPLVIQSTMPRPDKYRNNKDNFLDHRYESRDGALRSARIFYGSHRQDHKFFTGFSARLGAWIWCNREDNHLLRDLQKVRAHTVAERFEQAPDNKLYRRIKTARFYAKQGKSWAIKLMNRVNKGEFDEQLPQLEKFK